MSSPFETEHGLRQPAEPAEASGEVDLALRSVSDSPAPAASQAEPPLDPELVRLRGLLFDREIALLRKLEERLDDPQQHAQETSAVIAEALILRSGKDSMLQGALEPMVEKIFKDAMRKSPMDFVNVIFPLMGPAIRRSIAETFRSMLENFHKTIEYVFSWKGLRWRWEAWRTGKSFSEVVLLNTLVYRVEQVFFIHTETGLVLSHLSSEGVETQDADMVSAMFTAIQDFVRDAFAGGGDGSLHSLQLGDHTVFVERGQFCYLASVVRGTAPMEFKNRLADALGVLQVRYSEALQDFNGDTAPFEAARWELEGLMESHYVNEGAPLPRWVKLMPAVVLLALLLVGAGVWYSRHKTFVAAREQYHFMETSARKVGTEPGLILLHAGETAPGHWEYVFQKDPLAGDPKEFLDKLGIDPAKYTLTVIPFVSYEGDMVAERAKDRIHPPDTVKMEFSPDGTLHFSGTAPMAWILGARQEALSLPGVEKVDMSGLTDPRIGELQTMVDQVNATVVEFPMGKDTPVPQDAAKLAAAMDTLAKIEKLAQSMNIAVSLTIYGHADAVGSDKRNYEISQARTRTMAAMLYERGASIPIAMYGMGSEHAKREGVVAGEDQASRRVEMKVHLAQLPSTDSILNILR